MSDDKAWFAPRRFGIGAGWPVRWQGWALLGTILAIVGLCALTLGHDDPRALAIILPAIAITLVISARKTRGGWRWRWGERF